MRGRCVTLCVPPPPTSPYRCVPLSDPAAIPDTPRGRGSQPPQEEETAEQEESLSLFDLPPAPQAIRGGPDRHPGQCRLRGPQLRHPPLTPRARQAIGLDSIKEPTSPHPPPPRTPDLSLRRSPQSLAASPEWGERGEGEPERPEVGDRTCRQEQWLF